MTNNYGVDISLKFEKLAGVRCAHHQLVRKNLPHREMSLYPIIHLFTIVAFVKIKRIRSASKLALLLQLPKNIDYQHRSLTLGNFSFVPNFSVSGAIAIASVLKVIHLD